MEYHSQRTGLWIRLRVFPSAGGISVYSVDVSERKQAEENLNRLLAEIQRQKYHWKLVEMEALREEMNAPMPPGSRVSYQKEIAAARFCMEPDNWMTAWEFGRRLSLDQTLLLAQQIASTTSAPMDID